MNQVSSSNVPTPLWYLRRPCVCVHHHWALSMPTCRCACQNSDFGTQITVTLGGDPQSPQTHLLPLPLLPEMLWMCARGSRLDVDIGVDADFQVSMPKLRLWHSNNHNSWR